MNEKTVTICGGCPCVNVDRKGGGVCNLGYDCDLEWFDKDGNIVADTPEMRARQKEFHINWCSTNCGLLEVRFLKDGIHTSFIPQTHRL